MIPNGGEGQDYSRSKGGEQWGARLHEVRSNLVRTEPNTQLGDKLSPFYLHRVALGGGPSSTDSLAERRREESTKGSRKQSVASGPETSSRRGSFTKRAASGRDVRFQRQRYVSGGESLLASRVKFRGEGSNQRDGGPLLSVN